MIGWIQRDFPKLWDALQDPCPEIEKLAKFMGVAYTQELISEIAEAVQMGKMKEGKKHSSMSIDELKQLNVYRKGLQIFNLRTTAAVQTSYFFHAL